MKTFYLNNDIRIDCEYQKTQNGFRHLATAYYNGREIETAKCTYLNRTWEAYEFQSVLEELVHKLDQTKALPLKYRYELWRKIKNEFKEEDRKEVDHMFGSIGVVALMGEVFGKTTKQKNDWKEKMLKAGLGKYGLEMPSDWPELTEEEKERRLNGVINVLANNK